MIVGEKFLGTTKFDLSIPLSKWARRSLPPLIPYSAGSISKSVVRD